jgi:hypothetical protein
MTKQEKRIAIELGSVVIVFLLIAHLATINWKTVAVYAPVATPIIALGAAIIALRAIATQRDIAMRRAAIDFFLKTEMDATILGLYATFKNRAPDLPALAQNPKFAEDQDYKSIRGFLNICELIAVGIREDTFSNRVSFAYWGDVLPQSYQAACPLIERIRVTSGEGTAHTYCDLEWLCERWKSNPPRA